AFLAVPPGRHQARRTTADGNVSGAAGGNRPESAARSYPGAHPGMAALRRARPLAASGMARQLSRPKADLVSVAAHRAGLRREPARFAQAGIRRVAVEPVLGADGIGD